VILSVFDMFNIGIGPSSSHAVGPMRAALRFARGLARDGLLETTASVRVELFGSLGATGKGHGSDFSVMLGLAGESPEEVEPDTVPEKIATITKEAALMLLGTHRVAFPVESAIVFHRKQTLPFHPNGMRFYAFDAGGRELRMRQYYSVGGGFVVDEETAELGPPRPAPPHPFRTGAELLDQCQRAGLSISTLMLENESHWQPRAAVIERLMKIRGVMAACIKRGCEREGILPGGLKVKRRAASLHRRLKTDPRNGEHDSLVVMDWVNLFALAVNEENAAHGRVVTAPTNGAAGIVPAVIEYYSRFVRGADEEGVTRFLLTAGAIGILYKINASISGAEVGCQGEVGVACSMAAAGLTEVLGGTPEQVENAAEIGMEHNLGLTCDPIGGLVQVPCIERNAMGAVKAINAARLALSGDGKHKVSLDKVIATMRQTGADMKTKYKETARGGLAVNIIEC
jgi:L-serine dehydratase